jgi:Flp pilus assembly protein TadG
MKTRQIIKEHKGGSAIEFALVLPVLLLFVFGIIEWGLYLFNNHVITNASREGARKGIVQASPRVSLADIETAVHNYSDSHLVSFADTKPSPVINISLDGSANTTCPTGNGFGSYLAVEVRYDYTFLLLPSLTGGLLPQLKTITARTAMGCE